ncbi:MAG: PaaI family thioesterase [Gaiellaceae bacterium]
MSEPLERRPWEDVPEDVPHVWRTLGYRRPIAEPGRVVVEWNAPAELAFPVDGGHIVHGGLVATILDTAMGGACWTLLEEGETFLTAELRTEFHRATRPGLLRADGRVVQRTKRLMFCASELYDAGGVHLASGRCTQVLRTAR